MCLLKEVVFQMIIQDTNLLNKFVLA
jgi:hypothetical protein